VKNSTTTTTTTTTNIKNDYKKNIRMIISNYVPIFILAAVVLFFAFASPYFLTKININNVILNLSLKGTMVLGMTFVLLSGGIDLSIGAIMALGPIYAALSLDAGFPFYIAILVGLGTGLIVGAINGFLVAYLDMVPFIVTLATATICRGLAILAKGGYAIMISNQSFLGISGRTFLSISIPTLIFVIAIIVCYVMLEKTTFGLSVYSVGSNFKGAKLSGIKTNKVILLVYMISGFCAALSGLLSSAYVATAAPNMGIGMELSIISAVVLGGVSLFGGEGKIVLALCGFLIIEILINGLTLLGIGSDIQYLVRGFLLLLAVFINVKMVKE